MSRDFEMVKSRRNIPSPKQEDVTIITPKQNSRMEDAIADNFEQILELASGILEIENMKVKSDAVIRQMEESRKNLLAEAEAYATKKNADTNGVVQKMQTVREMMRDFYQYNNNSMLTSEDFSRIISSIVSEMGNL